MQNCNAASVGVYSEGRLQHDSESLYPSTAPKYLMTDRFSRKSDCSIRLMLSAITARSNSSSLTSSEWTMSRSSVRHSLCSNRNSAPLSSVSYALQQNRINCIHTSAYDFTL